MSSISPSWSIDRNKLPTKTRVHPFRETHDVQEHISRNLGCSAPWGPADLTFDEKEPLPKLGGMFDGSVIHLKKDPDEKLMKYLIMPADGQPLDLEKLEY
jgi:hypothetical protein